MIAKAFARLALFLALFVFAAGCKSDPPKPGEGEFGAANAKVASFESDVGFGNTPASTAWAKKAAVALKKLEAESFEGGKEADADGITKGNFLVYCLAQGSDIVFLVQAPNLDTYEGDARKALFELAWEATQGAVGPQSGKNLVVALRGKLLYGALGKGKVGSPAPAPELGTAIDETALYAYFAPGAAPAAAPAPSAPAASGRPAASAAPAASAR